MRKTRVYTWALVCALTTFYSSQSIHAAILGIEWDTGKLYSVSTSNAALTLIGNTGVQRFAALEFAPDGTLYGFTENSDVLPALYRINPLTAASTFIGNLGNVNTFVFEGALAFSPAGVAYGTNTVSSASPGLFTINLTTGALTNVGTISGGSHDINGLAWRSDGMLVGLDRVNNTLITINPATAASSFLASLPFVVGSIGGMTVQGSTGYIATGGPNNPFAGSSQLYSFDLFTGATNFIGTFSPTITGAGISGLAVPEPAMLAFFTVGAGLMLRRKR
jgi:hypothetical protein